MELNNKGVQFNQNNISVTPELLQRRKKILGYKK